MLELVPGNRVTLLRSGAEYFPALEAAIDRARHEVYLETYIFEDDATGRRIAQALVRAARRGAAVRLLIDGFGSKDASGVMLSELALAGVAVMKYRPEVSPWRFARHRLRRLHRKLATIDIGCAFVGGINIIDDMHTPGQTPPRFDFAVRVEGPLVAEIVRAVHRLWSLVSWAQLSRHGARIPRRVAVPPPCGNQRAAFLIRDNFRHRRDIEQAYLEAIENARTEVLIANAYFFPGVNFRRALAEAVARGVRVVLLLQGRVEYVLLHYASRALYGSLLDAGVEIFEYHKSFLHAKVAVIDRRWATVGSSNIDPFSLLLAREANVVLDDVEFAGELRRSLQEAIAHGARPVQPEGWHRQPLTLRIATWLSYFLARFLTGIFGYGKGLEPRW
ncbi:MAG TPA: cardiolipin synthase ClsB [Burkholderiales bacterium]|nr:cardiolipin synthase ClsB [Burkholderiales bacterium]